MTSDEKIDTDIGQAGPTETSVTNAAPETEVTDNTDWEEAPLTEEGDETPAETVDDAVETVAEPVVETQEDIEDGEDLAEEQEPEPEEGEDSTAAGEEQQQTRESCGISSCFDSKGHVMAFSPPSSTLAVESMRLGTYDSKFPQLA